MCTNYRPSSRDAIQARFDVNMPDVALKPEAFPGYQAPIVRVDGQREAITAVFGLIPIWSKTGKDFRHCYNARIETVSVKPSFKASWSKRQFCIVPMDCFYEYHYGTGKPVRWRISHVADTPLVAAGIWQVWKNPDGQWVPSFSLVTINADSHDVMRQFHPPADEKRMPILLQPEHFDAWLTGTTDDALALAQPLPPELLKVEPAPMVR